VILKHYFIKNIAHSSYLLGGQDTCVVVDPSRDVDNYIDGARSEGWRITHILETHLHADFLSGHLELAARTGAAIYAPRHGDCLFPHVPVSEGDTFTIENVKIKVMETPGHTPEHVSYLVTDLARGEEPVGVFCGDTLFVGDVGRPDLFPGRAVELAGQLFDSLHGKLLTLSDFCEVYPTHGSGSLCGRNISGKQLTTIGYERRYNSSLRIADRDAFIKSLTSGMPPVPDYFRRCSEINRKGPVATTSLPRLTGLPPAILKERISQTGAVVLDIRGYDAFGGQHIPGSWHVSRAGNFALYAGWVIPAVSEILLVADSTAGANEAVTWLRRVGLDRTTGYLEGGMDAWAAEGFDTDSVPQISSAALHKLISGPAPFTLLDVRSNTEYADSHIEGALNIPVQDLRTRWQDFDPDAPLVVICASGNRSSLGASILKQNGFNDVTNVAGGMAGYSAAGFTGTCNVCTFPQGKLAPAGRL
jgi:hydroxyacylglutathione hydrolase